MHCPFCGYNDTRVVDSRLANEGEQIRRRRECLSESCKERFSTYEVATFNMPPVTKSTGDKQAFDSHKLRAGLMRATEKRPVDAKAIDSAVLHIQKRILEHDKVAVKSSQIAEYVMEQLRKLDEVAFIRFVSVYKNFNDIGEFIEAIEGLENSPTPELKKCQVKIPGAD